MSFIIREITHICLLREENVFLRGGDGMRYAMPVVLPHCYCIDGPKNFLGLLEIKR